MFTVDNSIVCAGTASTFTNLVAANSSSNFSVGSYLWTFGDGLTSTLPNPSHTYTTPGLYTVSLQVTETQGCIYSYSLPAQMDVRGPIIDFTVNKTQVCITQSDPVTFTSSVTKAVNDPAVSYTYYWTFGDGGNSTDQNPVHTYSATGTYTVTLQVTNNLGCITTISHTGTVSAPTFAAGFTTTRDIYCKNDLVSFTDSSVGTITSYDWDLNDDGLYEIIGGASSQSRTFTSTGTFTIRQRVTSSLDCTDVFIKTLTVVDGTGTFHLNNPELGCAPVAAQFHNDDAAVDVDTYSWTFGDGEVSSARDPNHYYTVPGHYTVTLTEVLTGGCTKSTTMPIVIAGAVGTFTYDNTPDCIIHTEHYFANNFEGVTSLTWDFGDGVTTTEAVPGGVTSASTTHDYTTWGNRLPILILRDPTCGDYAYYYGVDQRINTSEAPVAAFTSAAVGGLTCEKLVFQFTDQSTIVDPRYAVSTWDWDFGDLSPHSTLQNPTHAYAVAGDYTVKLTVTNGFLPGACPTSISHVVTANPLPLATVPNQTQVFCSGSSSLDMTLGTSNSLIGTTFAWTRTTPAGITSALATSGSGLAIGDVISGGVFTNTTAAPVVVTYTITPTGPTPTFCVGDPITATITVDPTPTISSA
ncbi:MAG: PKD domain-containing protein, partial [Candidatus Staskawiczbacteria bacterium]